MIFHDFGDIADICSPSNISKKWDRSRSLVLSLKPLKVVCCWLLPNPFLVETYFILGAKDKLLKIPTVS